MADDTRDTLDAAIRAHAEEDVADGEVITSWIVLAATREFGGGGAVIHLLSDDAMPMWEARGLLTTALRSVDRAEDTDQGDDG